MSFFSRTQRRPHHLRNRLRDSAPLRFLSRQLPSSGWCEAVILELAISSFVELPARGDPPFAAESMERGIQRAVLNLQDVFGRPLDVLRNVMAVLRSPEQ